MRETGREIKRVKEEGDKIRVNREGLEEGESEE